MCVFVCVRVCMCVWWNYVTDEFSEGWSQARNYTLKGKKHTQNICDIEINWCASESFTAFFFQKFQKIAILICDNQ